MCLTALSGTGFAAAETQPVYVVTSNTANVYESADITSAVLHTLSHKAEVEIEFESGEPKVYESGGYQFFKITTTSLQGYILRDLVVEKNTSLQEIPNFNAKTNDKCFVYEREGNTYTKTTVSLTKHQQIYLYEGYKSSLKYTAIAYVFENEVRYGYIKTDFVDPNGINPIIITCIVLIVAILGIMFTFVFIRGRKKKMS